MQELLTKKRCLARLRIKALRLTDKSRWREKSSMHAEFVVPLSLSIGEQARSVGIA